MIGAKKVWRGGENQIFDDIKGFSWNMLCAVNQQHHVYFDVSCQNVKVLGLSNCKGSQ